MLITKILGATFLILSGMYAFSHYEKKETKKLKQINALIDFVEHAKNQVECFLTPSQNIISSYPKDKKEILGITGSEKITTVAEMMDSSKLLIDAEAIEIIKDFSKKFGKSYRAEQIASCNYCKNELIKIRDSFKEKREQKRKVRLAICLCVTLSVVILLF